jgi:hypothetical protein
LLLEEFFPTFTQFFFQRRAASKKLQYHTVEIKAVQCEQQVRIFSIVEKKGVQYASFEKEKQQDIIISVQNTKI